MPGRSERDGEHIPVDPQEFLNFVEWIERVHGQAVSLEAHVLTLNIVSRAVALHVYGGKRLDTPPQEALNEFQTAVSDFAEYLLSELTTVQNPDELRSAVQNLHGMTEWWLNHFQESDDHTSGTA